VATGALVVINILVVPLRVAIFTTLLARPHAMHGFECS
jgi:hypothetical protein